MLRPGVEGIRGSMVIRLRPCMRSNTSLLSSTPPPPPSLPSLCLRGSKVWCLWHFEYRDWIAVSGGGRDTVHSLQSLSWTIISRPASQVDQSMQQCIDRLTNQPRNQPTNQPINTSTNPINEPINLSTNQSCQTNDTSPINQSH